MDMNVDVPPQSSWVEQSVMHVRHSPEYRAQVVDEWYETLPVPVWDARGTWVVIGFGKNIRPDAGSRGAVQTRMPHLTCAVSYPTRELKWRQGSWPVSLNAEVPNMPLLAGGVMERRRKYYSALSSALSFGAFGPQDGVLARGDACKAASEALNALLPAASFPNLMGVYAAPVVNMREWIQINCR